MAIVRTSVVAAVLAVAIATSQAHAGIVTVRGQDLVRRVVVVRDITPHRERPVRHAYGLAVRLGPLVSAIGTIHSASAAAKLDATLLTEVRTLYRAPYRISAQKLAQAEATDSQARAKLESAVSALRARYGDQFASALLNDRQLAERIDSAAVAVVEATLPYPRLMHPPRTATARIEGGPDIEGRRVTLRLLGIGGRVPSGMIGESLYYLAPPLQAGTMVRVSLWLARRPTITLKLPVSALIFDGARLIAFRRIAGSNFRSFPLSDVRAFYSHGHIAGYQSLWTGRSKVPIVVKGAGLLWSLADRPAGKR